MGDWASALLIFFTVPIYHWIARALDGDWARGDIQVGPAPHLDMRREADVPAGDTDTPAGDLASGAAHKDAEGGAR